jgi:hypothetical protein
LIGLLNIFSTLCLSLDGSSSSEDEEDEEDADIDSSDAPLNNNNSSQPFATTAGAAAAPEQIPSRAHPLIPVVEQILPVLIPVAEKW